MTATLHNPANTDSFLVFEGAIIMPAPCLNLRLCHDAHELPFLRPLVCAGNIMVTTGHLYTDVHWIHLCLTETSTGPLLHRSLCTLVPLGLYQTDIMLSHLSMLSVIRRLAVRSLRTRYYVFVPWYTCITFSFVAHCAKS